MSFTIRMGVPEMDYYWTEMCKAGSTFVTHEFTVLKFSSTSLND